VNALVTGGAGFIGSAVARTLLEQGESVRVVDNFLTGNREHVPKGAELVSGDLRDPDEIERACEDIEVVFHQAAVRSVPRSVDEPLLATECNVLGTLNLLVAAQKAGVRRVVYASSSSVYGDRATIQREDMIPEPLSPYAASKLAAEHYCGVWTHLHGLSTVSLRYFNVFGPGQDPRSKYANVFPAFTAALVARTAPEVHWDGEQAKDFTYIDDVVRANLLAATAGPAADGEVINIGCGEPKSVNHVLRAVSDALGIWVDPVSRPKRAGDVRRTHADVAKARSLLGWSPAADWATAVGRTVDGIAAGLSASRAADL